MEENNGNIILLREYKNLKCLSYNHFWIFVVITIFNIILFIQLYFMNKIYKAFYLIGAIIYFLLIFIPIYPLWILKNRLLKHKLKLFQKISTIIIFIILFSGLLVNLVVFLNISRFYSFYINCPYNFSYKDIAKIFNINYNRDRDKNIQYNYSKKCSDRRCLFIQKHFENISSFFTYLCNFDSSNDFQEYNNSINNNINNNIYKNEYSYDTYNKNYTSITCKQLNDISFYDEQLFLDKKEEEIFIIKSYYKICSSKYAFYICDKYEKPEKYDLNYNYSCPNNSDDTFIILIAVISIIFNILISLIKSFIMYSKYNRINIIYQNIHNNPVICSTRKNTNSNSESKSNENINNQNPEILIVDSHTIRKEEYEETQNNKNISINIIQSDGVLTINKKNNNDMKKNPQLNEIDKSETKKIYLINNNIDLRNETGDN